MIILPLLLRSVPCSADGATEASASSSSTTTANVATQYQNLPYPPRDPANEKHGLITDFHPAFIDLKGFNRRVMTKPLAEPGRGRPVKVLVAGGGTGDVVVYLAEMCSRYLRLDYDYACGGVDGIEFCELSPL